MTFQIYENWKNGEIKSYKLFDASYTSMHLYIDAVSKKDCVDSVEVIEVDGE